MNKYLNNNKIDYVLFHLFKSLKIDKSIQSFFIYKSSLSESPDKKIIFNLSSKDFDYNKTKWIKDIPVLFPISERDQFYSFEDNNLVFHHDLLKSAFYLLSGYQELKPEYVDKYHRFPYELSVQKKLGITKKPVVNYYFEIIHQGIKEFCKNNSIKLKSNQSNNSVKFFLTHDIDVVDTYNINDVIYYLKVLVGISNSNLPYKLKIRKASEYLYNYLFTKKNLNWDFNFLRSIEKESNLQSAFYFLPKGIKHKDSYYSFTETRMKKLFSELIDDNCEIGIHGTVKSSIEESVLLSNIKELENVINQKVVGLRQHRLMFDINITPKLHESAELIYDTTLGFAEHEGFRNSYCHPFKLYNFKEDRAYKTWEIPLNVMDATLFRYRKLSNEKAMESVIDIMNEVNKFNGVFTLLWHNGNFDEIIYPGITKFYKDMIQYISKKSSCVLGKDIENWI